MATATAPRATRPTSLAAHPGVVRFAGAAGIAGIVGALLGAWLPRGPMSPLEGLVTMTLGLGVGLAGGYLTRSRWMMLVAPVAIAFAWEIARLGADGPTVDGFHLSTYGIMALVVGRGFTGVLAFLPLLVGVSYGSALARRRIGVPPRARGITLIIRRVGTGVATLAVVLLAIAVARPAGTDAITGPDGEVIPGSIAELTTVETGGKELGLMLRGQSTKSPVLLFLAGGPGGSELGAMRRHLEGLEESFVVATFDQRGTGKSYGALDPSETLTLEQAVTDAVNVTNYLRERFGQRQVYLVGNSWGTVLGVLAAQRRPELYSAFVGTGQMVSPRATDRIFYEDTLAWARAEGNSDLVDELTSIGPPPYERTLDYETALSYEHEVYPYDHSRNSEGEGGFSENLLVREYTLLEQVHALGAVLDTFSVLYPQIQGIDFRKQARTLEVPVYLVQGRHEAEGRARLVDEWFAALEAPRKVMQVLDTSGHRPLFEQPSEFVAFMDGTVLRETR